MNLFIDVDSNKFVKSPYDTTPVLNINLTRGDVIPLNVGFVQNASLVTLPSGTAVTMGFKHNYSGAFVAYATAFDIVTGVECSPLYSTYLSLANTGVDALFNNGNGTPVYLVGQLSYGISGVSESSSNAILANIHQDINTPSGTYPLNSFVSFPAFVTGVSGVQTQVEGNVLVISSTGNGGGGDVTSVAGRTGDVVLSSTDLSDATSLGLALITVSDEATAQSNLGLTIGSNVQAWSALLDDIFNGQYPGLDGSQILNVLQSANNLSDLSDISSAVATLGLTIGSAVEAWSSNLDVLAGIAFDSSVLSAVPNAVNAAYGLVSMAGDSSITVSSINSAYWSIDANGNGQFGACGFDSSGDIYSNGIQIVDTFGNLYWQNTLLTTQFPVLTTTFDPSVLSALPNATNTANGLVALDGYGNLDYPNTAVTLANSTELFYPSSSVLADSAGNLYLPNGTIFVDSLANIYLPYSLYDSVGSLGSSGQILTTNGSAAIWQTLSFGGTDNQIVLGDGSLSSIDPSVITALENAVNSRAAALVTLDTNGNLDYPQTATTLADGGGNLYLGNGNQLSDNSGNIYVLGRTFIDHLGQMYYSQYSNLMVDTNGAFYFTQSAAVFDSYSSAGTSGQVLVTNSFGVQWQDIPNPFYGTNLDIVLGDGSTAPIDAGVENAIGRPVNQADGLVQLDGSSLFYPYQATTSLAPSYQKGALYFDTTLNKLRIGGATAWETVTSI